MSKCKFVLHIEEVEAFPRKLSDERYAFVTAPSMDRLARWLSNYLDADVVTEQQVYLPEITDTTPVSVEGGELP